MSSILLPGAYVVSEPRRGLPVYGRLLSEVCASGVIPIRLTADCARGRKGQRVYVLTKNTRPRRRGGHASGVRLWGPSWLRRCLRWMVKGR